MAETGMGRHIFRIAGVLTLICVCVALIVSGVYRLTEETYEKNLAEEKRVAIAALFGSETVATEELPTAPDDKGTLYRVTEGGTLVGYCVRIASAGFGGDIDMMVAISPEEKLLGVRILSMSETPGLGAKTNDESYLSQYVGKDADRTLTGGKPNTAGNDVDFITGATISSRAVLAGVNEATSQLRTYLNTTEEGQNND